MSTQASDSAVGLDAAAVEEWILALGLGAEPPPRFARAGSGKSNLTYLVTDLAGKRWILRRPPACRCFPPHTMSPASTESSACSSPRASLPRRCAGSPVNHRSPTRRCC